MQLFGCIRNARKGLAKNVNTYRITSTNANTNTIKDTDTSTDTTTNMNTNRKGLAKSTNPLPLLKISSCVKTKSIVVAESGSIESDYNLCVLHPHQQLWVSTHYNKCSRLVFTEQKQSSCLLSKHILSLKPFQAKFILESINCQMCKVGTKVVQRS